MGTKKEFWLMAMIIHNYCSYSQICYIEYACAKLDSFILFIFIIGELKIAHGIVRFANVIVVLAQMIVMLARTQH